MTNLPSLSSSEAGQVTGRDRVIGTHRLDGQAGNADLVESDEAGTVALLEVKASAAQHGHQFERYDASARARTPPARCYLIALDGESLASPGGWASEPSLAHLVRSWQGIGNPHAAWLASAVAGIFEGWTTQADGKLGVRRVDRRGPRGEKDGIRAPRRQ
jgi:hypothetical protein